MKNILVVVATGVGLFVATMLGLLAAQGRLNHEGTKNIPLVNSLFSKPAGEHKAKEGKSAVADAGAGDHEGMGETVTGPVGGKQSIPYRRGGSVLGEPGDAEDQGSGEPDATAGAQPKVGPAGGEAAGEGSEGTSSQAERNWAIQRNEIERRHPYPRGLFDFTTLKADITSDEFNQMVQRVREKEKHLVEMEAALNKKRREVETQMRDVRYRQEEVARQMQTVVQERARLDQRVEEFHKKVMLIKQDELAGLKENARNIANLDPEIGRDLILSWWNKGPDGQARAIKTLSLMKKDAVENILGTMQTDKIREILDKRLTLARTQEGGEKK